MTTHGTNFGFDQETTPADRHAIHDGFANLPGQPTHQHLRYSEPDEAILGGPWHPVFPLAEHFRANDEGNPGYTQNRNRGDHLSIPCWSEDGQAPSILEISFHKGRTSVEHITFPQAHETPEAERLSELLAQYETR